MLLLIFSGASNDSMLSVLHERVKIINPAFIFSICVFGKPSLTYATEFSLNKTKSFGIIIYFVSTFTFSISSNSIIPLG